MADKTLNLYEAKTRLSELIDRAAAGERIVIAKRGKPMACLVPLEQERPKRKIGGWEGRVWIADDFDAPDQGLIDAFEGKYSDDPKP